MQRKDLQLGKKSTHRSNIKGKFDAHRSIRDLQERIRKLENLISELALPEYFTPQLPADEPKRPGPKPVRRWLVWNERDRIVRMLEDHWPEIEPCCIPRVDFEELKGVLAKISQTAEGRHNESAEHLLKHMPDLMKFLSSDRFRRDPRQIANAFAGFPQIGVWRSLKICRERPCSDPIGERSIRCYVRRKHLSLYRELAADYSLVNFVSSLKRYRSKDSRLNAYTAARLYSSWKDTTAK